MLSNTGLRDKISYLRYSDTIYKDDLLDLIALCLDGWSVEQALNDIECGFDEEYIDVESDYDASDRAYDQYKDEIAEGGRN